MCEYCETPTEVFLVIGYESSEYSPTLFGVFGTKEKAEEIATYVRQQVYDASTFEIYSSCERLPNHGVGEPAYEEVHVVKVPLNVLMEDQTRDLFSDIFYTNN